MTAPLILVEAQPVEISAGSALTVRLAGGGGAEPSYYFGQHWRRGITGLPTIVASIAFDGKDLGTGSVPQAMTLRWAPSGSAALAEIAALHWLDAAITVRIGAAPTPPVLTTGKVIDATTSDGVLTLALSDPAADLKKPILKDRFLGAGGIEGPPEWQGKIKRRAWGRVFNLEGECIDTAHQIYCFGDPTRPWAEISTVRDKGATAASLTLLPWQGTVAATFAALQSATAPVGGGVVCPSIACVKWWTQPAGSLCADVKGEIGSGYVETAPAIVERIVAAVSLLPFAPGTVAAAIAARPAVVGWVAEDETGMGFAAMDALLGDVSLLWLIDNDQIVLREWVWGPAVASARSLDVSRKASFRPVSSRRLGYRRNHHVMTRDAIAGIVLATDVMFEDGSTAANLQAAVVQAQSAADEALNRIQALGDDGVLTGDEKSKVLLKEDAELTNEWNLLDTQAASLANVSGVASARSTASAAWSAWITYRNALSPAWNNTELDTFIDRGQFRGRLTDLRYALDLLSQALRNVAAIDSYNRVRNAQFPLGAQGWLAAGATSGISAVAVSTGTNGATGTRYIRIDATAAAGTQAVFITQAATHVIPVTPGERLAIQIAVESQGSNIASQDLRATPLDAAGAPLSVGETVLQTRTGAQAYGTPLRGFYTVPAGAAFVRIGSVTGTNGTAGAIVAVISQPMVSSARAGQNEFPSWSPGVADAAAGAAGAPALSLQVTRRAVALDAYASGNVKSFANANGQLLVFSGSDDITSGAVLAATAVGCTGTINTSFGSPVVGKPKGYYQVTAMSADMATLTLTASYGGRTLTEVVSLAMQKGGYEIVSALPTSDNFEGRVVYLDTTGKLYRYRAGNWTSEVPTEDLVGTIGPGQMALGVGGNMLVGAVPGTNARAYLLFANNPDGIAYTNPNGGTSTSGQTVIQSPGFGWTPTGPWTLPDFSTFAVHQPNADWGSSHFSDIWVCRIVDRDGNQESWWPVEPGRTYEFSVWTGAHRCQVEAFIIFGDGNRIMIPGAETAHALNNEEADANNDLSKYKRLVSRGSAPANARFALAVIRKGHTKQVAGYSDSWMFGTRPMFGETTPNATVDLPYSVPAYGWLRAEHIVARSITTNELAAGAVRADNIGAGEVTAAKMFVTELSAITARIGLLRTSVTGLRTEVSDNGQQTFNASNVLVFQSGIY